MGKIVSEHERDWLKAAIEAAGGVIDSQGMTGTGDGTLGYTVDGEAFSLVLRAG